VEVVTRLVCYWLLQMEFTAHFCYCAMSDRRIDYPCPPTSLPYHKIPQRVHHRPLFPPILTKGYVNVVIQHHGGNMELGYSVFWTSATLWDSPLDILSRNFNVTELTVDAVLGVDHKFLSPPPSFPRGPALVVYILIHACRACPSQ